METLLHIHALLCGSHFTGAGTYRQHQVQLGEFTPILYVQVPIEMKNLDADIAVRLVNVRTEAEKKELLAYVMWRLLWIHPFFDYNGRTVRLFGELFLLKHHMSLSTFS